jgi:PAS domain S-box-containing protein
MQELAQAAKRFSTLVEANPFGMIIGGLDGSLSYVNPAFLHILGYSETDVRAGLLRWDRLTPPEYEEADAHAVQQLRTSGRCEVDEKVFIAKDGRRIPILIAAATIEHSGRDPEVAAFLTDLTALKSAQNALLTANDGLERKIAERTAALEAEIFERARVEINLRELTGRLLRAQDEERVRQFAGTLQIYSDHQGTKVLGMLPVDPLNDNPKNFTNKDKIHFK